MVNRLLGKNQKRLKVNGTSKEVNVVGLWGLEIFIEGGEGRTCKKEIFSKPFHPTFTVFSFPLLSTEP
jgi:hypothetical protein